MATNFNLLIRFVLSAAICFTVQLSYTQNDLREIDSLYPTIEKANIIFSTYEFHAGAQVQFLRTSFISNNRSVIRRTGANNINTFFSPRPQIRIKRNFNRYFGISTGLDLAVFEAQPHVVVSELNDTTFLDYPINITQRINLLDFPLKLDLNLRMSSGTRVSISPGISYGRLYFDRSTSVSEIDLNNINTQNLAFTIAYAIGMNLSDKLEFSLIYQKKTYSRQIFILSSNELKLLSRSVAVNLGYRF